MLGETETIWLQDAGQDDVNPERLKMELIAKKREEFDNKNITLIKKGETTGLYCDRCFAIDMKNGQVLDDGEYKLLLWNKKLKTPHNWQKVEFGKTLNLTTYSLDFNCDHCGKKASIAVEDNEKPHENYLKKEV